MFAFPNCLLFIILFTLHVHLQTARLNENSATHAWLASASSGSINLAHLQHCTYAQDSTNHEIMRLSCKENFRTSAQFSKWASPAADVHHRSLNNYKLRPKIHSELPTQQRSSLSRPKIHSRFPTRKRISLSLSLSIGFSSSVCDDGGLEDLIRRVPTLDNKTNDSRMCSFPKIHHAVSQNVQHKEVPLRRL